MPIQSLRVGLISDTHGLLRPQALEAMRGNDFIIHAGDVGDPGILKQLAEIAPVTAVRGNVDVEPWTRSLPETAVLRVGEALIYVVHDIMELDIDPAAAGFHAVVFGHSHRPAENTRGGVLYINPGSAGPRRFTLPIAAGQLLVTATQLKARLFELDLSDTA